ncbi:pali-domain-containing protein [Dendrothele bispora CBS 962.96]|uniref:Pali-domain-containing protein n=1 Tax=Dendrothele bispora (strain CBS 962.96) TaxID=1314807 RepID=A0A4S8LFA4_DENBC|nr:pali-domain-containing protein [Dendrothele bispora CBS 962.96]
MSRKFFIPGIVFLFLAFVLSFFTSISAPTIHSLDIVRIDTNNADRVIVAPEDAAKSTHLGIWGFCVYDFNDDAHCENVGHGYQYTLTNFDRSSRTTIGASWTRGLAIHPVAAAVTFVAFCLSFSSHLTVLLAASITSFLAAFLTFLAFIIDIVLYAYVHHKVKDVSDIDVDVNTAPGFWLTFVALLFTLFAGCTVCFGRRKVADPSSSYPMMSNPTGFFSRFRKN